MKTKHLLLIFLIISIFFSCKKENKETQKVIDSFLPNITSISYGTKFNMSVSYCCYKMDIKETQVTINFNSWYPEEYPPKSC